MLVRLKDEIRKRRLHQYEVASSVGMSETRLSRITRGREAATDVEKKSLSSFLEVSQEELFDESE